MLKATHTRMHDSPPAWDGKRLVFAARSDDTTNLWQVDLPDGSGRVAGTPERLTTDTEFEVSPVILADGRVIYSSLVQAVDHN